jgi:hypothetical protein
VDHGAVANRRLRADRNAIDIAPDNGAVPDAATSLSSLHKVKQPQPQQQGGKSQKGPAKTIAAETTNTSAKNNNNHNKQTNKQTTTRHKHFVVVVVTWIPCRP